MTANRRSEITAEWTVRAHLTITRPNAAGAAAVSFGDDNNSLQHVTDDHQRDDEPMSPDRLGSNIQQRNDNPVCVVYKWCSDDNKLAYDGGNSGGVEPFVSDMTVPAPSDSGVSSSMTNVSGFIPRFRSTCNIILSASTDLLPKTNEMNDDVSTRCQTIYPVAEVNIHTFPDNLMFKFEL